MLEGDLVCVSAVTSGMTASYLAVHSTRSLCPGREAIREFHLDGGRRSYFLLDFCILFLTFNGKDEYYWLLIDTFGSLGAGGQIFLPFFISLWKIKCVRILMPLTEVTFLNF